MICNTYKKFFKTVGEPSRTELLFTLKDEGDLYVGDMVEKLGREQSSISHSLRVLKSRGFVYSEKHGKKRKYVLTEEAKTMLEYMDDYIKKHFHKDCKCGK